MMSQIFCIMWFFLTSLVISLHSKPNLNTPEHIQYDNVLVTQHLPPSSGVKWVKDWEDYLGLNCCQPLSLTHLVSTAIWQLHSAELSDGETGQKRWWEKN